MYTTPSPHVVFQECFPHGCDPCRSRTYKGRHILYGLLWCILYRGEHSEAGRTCFSRTQQDSCTGRRLCGGSTEGRASSQLEPKREHSAVPVQGLVLLLHDHLGTSSKDGRRRRQRRLLAIWPPPSAETWTSRSLSSRSRHYTRRNE